MLAFVNTTNPCGSRPFAMYLTAGMTSKTQIDLIELLTPAFRQKLRLEEEELYVRQELASKDFALVGSRCSLWWVKA